MVVTRNTSHWYLRQLRSGRSTIGYVHTAIQSRHIHKSSPWSSPVSKQLKRAGPSSRSRQTDLRGRVSCGSTEERLSRTSALHNAGEVNDGIDKAGSYLTLVASGNR